MKRNEQDINNSSIAEVEKMDKDERKNLHLKYYNTDINTLEEFDMSLDK